MSYSKDREFTDYIHNHLAAEIIYPAMGWKLQDLNQRLGKNIDLNNAVDYIAVDQKTLNIIPVQERFREQKYAGYSDFTIRYMRPENSHEDRRLSEFFKLDADYFIYGIINASKENYKQADDFSKYAVLDLCRLRDLLDDETIIIDGSMPGYRCRKKGDKMYCPVNENYDHSSNFVPFDICILNEIAPDVICCQKGFF